MRAHVTTSVGEVKQRNVGRSGLRVSEIGVSTTNPDVVTRFLDEGGTLLDVSPASAPALAPVNPRDLVISAQIGVDPARPVGRRVDCSRRALLNQLDELLSALGLEHVDLLSAGHFDPRTPPEEVAETLQRVVESGRARYAGVRGYRGWQLAVTPGMSAVHHEYSLLKRGAEEELVPAAGHLGIGVIAENPFAHGLLTGESSPEAQAYSGSAARTVVDALDTAADGLGVTPATVALAWTLGRVDAAMVTADSPAVVSEAAAAAATTIPRAIDRALDDVSRVG